MHSLLSSFPNDLNNVDDIKEWILYPSLQPQPYTLETICEAVQEAMRENLPPPLPPIVAPVVIAPLVESKEPALPPKKIVLPRIDRLPPGPAIPIAGQPAPSYCPTPATNTNSYYALGIKARLHKVDILRIQDIVAPEFL